MPFFARLWAFMRTHRTMIIAFLVVIALLVPPPAEAQFNLIFNLIGIVNSGLGTLNNVMTTVNNTLRDVIGPILQGISSAISAAQQIHRVSSQRIEQTEKMVCRYQVRLVFSGRTQVHPTGLLVGEFWEQQMVGEKDIDLDQKSQLLDR